MVAPNVLAMGIFSIPLLSLFEKLISRSFISHEDTGNRSTTIEFLYLLLENNALFSISKQLQNSKNFAFVFGV